MTGLMESRAASLPIVGGALALDFCNTSSGRETPGHREHLGSIDNVLAWARHAGLTDEAVDDDLRRVVEGDASFGPRLLARALALREAIHAVVSALAAGLPVGQRDLDIMAGLHAACLARGRLMTREGGFGWSWTVAEAPDEVVLGPIVASAMTILADADRTRLKSCPGHHCGWLFLDATKNNSRRWCEMDVCGNRAKQSRQRTRRSRAD